MKRLDDLRKSSEKELGTCSWQIPSTTLEKEYNLWGTDCGNTYQFYDGGPETNGYKFCPYCGKRIKEVEEDDFWRDFADGR